MNQSRNTLLKYRFNSRLLICRLKNPYFRIRIDILNQEYIVYYVGTNLGRIYKIVQYYRNGESLSKLLDIFEVAPNEAIQVMEISQTRKSLYIGTDHRIKQIDLAMCNRRYDNCFRCVRDPYCGWDKEANTCRPYELDLLQVGDLKPVAYMILNSWNEWLLYQLNT